MFRLSVLTLLLASAALPVSKLQIVDETSYAALVNAHKGNVLLVDFWATWCAPCRVEMPLLAKLEQKLKSKGFRLVTVSADEPEQQAEAVAFLNKYGIGEPAYLKQARNDDKFINLVDPKWSGALPALILYDKTGKKARVFSGETDIATVEKAIAALL